MLFEHTSNTSDMMGMSCCYWLLVSVWILSDSCTTTASMERDTVLQELPLLTLSPSHPLTLYQQSLGWVTGSRVLIWFLLVSTDGRMEHIKSKGPNAK